MTVREDVNERAQARVGKVLKGKWRLDSVLGVGGMATVYAATHRNRSRVAIKMLHPEVAVSQDVTARFLREGYVGNAVAHPGSVKVLDDDITEDGAPFLVMELLEGESLGARLDRDGVFSAHEVALLADQLLDVLSAAHAAQIVHRDLKPDNVLLTSEGRIKVLDFGIARLREAAGDSSASTQVGSLLGTPAFMAPEQALGRWKEVDGRTDIWAVGATLFTLLSGRFVHECEALQEQLVRAATTKAPRLQEVAPASPDWIAEIVDRALAFEQSERFADAPSMRAALRAAAPGIDFPSYPLSSKAQHSGPFAVSRPFTPASEGAPVAAPGLASSPSFGDDATLVAPQIAVAVTGSSGGTFASVQALARSARESVPQKRSRTLLLVLAGLGVCGGVAAVALGRAPLGAGEAPSRAVSGIPAEPLRPPAAAHVPREALPEPAPVLSAASSAALPLKPGPSKRSPKLPARTETKPTSKQENIFDNRH